MNIQTCLSHAAAALAVMVLAGCSDIKTDDRLIEMPAVAVDNRVVLVEEFTGQNCRNCPQGHKDMESLLEQYPENLICVSIHGGPLAYNEKNFPVPNFGLATDEGDTYYKDNNSPEQPSAVVNRRGGAIFRDKWATSIKEELQKKTYVEMEVNAKYNPASGEIAITTGIDSHENYNAHLQLWVVESGIVSIQNDNGKNDMNYVHNHVFRGTVNGLYGEDVTLKPRTSETYNHTVKVKDHWTVDNVEIVAFVYDNTGVIQAAKAHVLKD